MSESWSYVDATTIEIAGDLTEKYYANQLIKIVQNSLTKFFIITAVNLVSTNTRLSIYGGGVYALTNHTITAHNRNIDGAPPGLPFSFAKISPSLITAENDFLVGTTAGVVAKKTLAETQAILGVGSFDLADAIHDATSKGTPVDNDELSLVDSAASYVLKKLTWANLKATLKTYFDTLYGPVYVVYSTNAGQTINNASVTIINFEDKVHDSHNAVTTGASWKFTAPRTGFYFISAICLLNDTTNFSGSETLAIVLYKGGNAVREFDERRPWSGEDYPTVHGSTGIYLSKDEYIDIRVVQTSGANISLYTDGIYNYVTIFSYG